MSLIYSLLVNVN